jgi:hypothetical protein
MKSQHDHQCHRNRLPSRRQSKGFPEQESAFANRSVGEFG